MSSKPPLFEEDLPVMFDAWKKHEDRIMHDSETTLRRLSTMMASGEPPTWIPAGKVEIDRIKERAFNAGWEAFGACKSSRLLINGLILKCNIWDLCLKRAIRFSRILMTLVAVIAGVVAVFTSPSNSVAFSFVLLIIGALFAVDTLLVVRTSPISVGDKFLAEAKSQVSDDGDQQDGT